MARHKKNYHVDLKEKEAHMIQTQVTTQTSLEEELAKVKEELEKAKEALAFLPAKNEEPEMHFGIDGVAAKKKLEQQKYIDSQIVTGKFINRRAPGQPAKLTYLKYGHETVKWWTFEDGKVYDIPRGFADMINNYYYTPVFIQSTAIMDPNRPTSAIQEVDTSNKKYAFVPMDF